VHFDFATTPPRDRYKLLVSTVVPRPIALVSTIDGQGRSNAAPFSFFNVVSEDPALVVLGIGGREPARDGDKDTMRNIRAGGGFVVNLVDEALLAAMNVCAIDFPPGVDEMAAAGLTAQPSLHVAAPGIAEAPVRLECRVWQILPVGGQARSILIGEVLGMSLRDGIVAPDTLRVDIDALDLVGRMHGGGWYVRLHDRIRLDRLAAPPHPEPKETAP
jgi:flavin reductase (DIM6/NTAB) family NADH-FMN oxidoreductase RutF